MAELKPIITDVGLDAGKVFHYLENTEGEEPIRATQLKKDLDMTTSAIYLALGWLAREDEVELLKKSNSVQVCLN